jgi:hypothetical protein
MRHIINSVKQNECKKIRALINDNTKYKGLLFKNKLIDYRNIIMGLKDIIISITFLKQNKEYYNPKYIENVEELNIINEKMLKSNIFYNYFTDELPDEFLIVVLDFNIKLIFFKNNYYIL